MPYVKFTEQQKEQARMTDIADIIRRIGGTLKRSGSEQEWMDGTQKVTIREPFRSCKRTLKYSTVAFILCGTPLQRGLWSAAWMSKRSPKSSVVSPRQLR